MTLAATLREQLQMARINRAKRRVATWWHLERCEVCRMQRAAQADLGSAVSMLVRQCCDQCDDGDGHGVFPYYGVAPHTHAPGPMLGSTRLLPADQWGDNFREDPECPGQGTYLRCEKCGRGEAPAA